MCKGRRQNENVEIGRCGFCTRAGPPTNSAGGPAASPRAQGEELRPRRTPNAPRGPRGRATHITSVFMSLMENAEGVCGLPYAVVDLGCFHHKQSVLVDDTIYMGQHIPERCW